MNLDLIVIIVPQCTIHMNQIHSGMVVVVQLVMTVALYSEHHGSTITSLNLKVELLK